MLPVSRFLALFTTLFLFACTTAKDGAIEGTILPQGTGATLAVLQGGKKVRTLPLAGSESKFRLALAAGTYRITVTARTSSSYRAVDNVVVRAGETTLLPPVNLAMPEGKATLSGRILPPQQGSEVVLYHEGKERAAVHTDAEGKYEFTELPAGTYDVEAHSPGHAADTARVNIRGDEKVEQTSVLFPVVDVNGVDWSTGKIRATGIGRPPLNGTNASVRRAMAERAAIADGQRNLLRIIGQIRLDSSRTVQDTMTSGAATSRIQGFISGYRLVSERDIDGGAIEVTLEVPLTGPDGLSRIIGNQN